MFLVVQLICAVVVIAALVRNDFRSQFHIMGHPKNVGLQLLFWVFVVASWVIGIYDTATGHHLAVGSIRIILLPIVAFTTMLFLGNIRHLPFFLLAAGAWCNFLVISANNGLMPVMPREDQAVVCKIFGPAHPATGELLKYPGYMRANRNTKLSFLCDRFGSMNHGYCSAGDILLLLACSPRFSFNISDSE